jgi:cytoskeletal protein RodZ
MPTVAEQLRRAREQQNLNIYQAAEITKIKTDHIRALEAGDWDTFSAPVYIRGFVRTSARALKLDEAQIAADLESELGKTEKYCEPPPLTNHPKSTVDFLMLQLSKMNWRILASLGVVVVVLALGMMLLRQFHRRPQTDHLKNLGPGLYQPKSGSSGETLPLPTNSPRR